MMYIHRKQRNLIEELVLVLMIIMMLMMMIPTEVTLVGIVTDASDKHP